MKIFLTNLKFNQTCHYSFKLISSLLSNRLLHVDMDGKSLHELEVNVRVPKGSISILIFYSCTLIIFPVMLILSVTLLSMVMILVSPLNVIGPLICDNSLKSGLVD